MAKKSKKIEKETRRLIESISDLVSKNKDGSRYKFKGAKKKTIRAVKRSCVHWIIRKGKEYPAVEEIHEGYWTCKICGREFVISPLKDDEDKLDLDQYRQACRGFVSLVDHVSFYLVKMGGDASDTKVIVKLKELVPKFEKIAVSGMKQLNKRHEMESRRTDDGGSAFSNYASMGYRT
jgi:hypothetical protein